MHINKEVLSLPYKELSKIRNNNKIRKWAKDIHRYITKEDIDVIIKHLKR